MLINGIEELGSRPDLLDRTLMVALPPIAKEHRKDRKTFRKEFDTAQPRLLGGIFDAVSMALRDHDHITLPSLERMADFMRWAAAASPAFGGQEAFLRAYEDNVARLNALALESNPVVNAIVELLDNEDGAWEGNATELLAQLNLSSTTVSAGLTPQGWPKSARALAGILRRLAPALLSEDIKATFRDHRRLWTLSRPQEEPRGRDHRGTRHYNDDRNK
jgi:putative DNA primase/helicase